jgi:hypothetical protein
VLADARVMPPPPLGRAQAKWAAEYTHDVFTGGIQSTQRNESMSACLTGSTPLDELVDALDMVLPARATSARRRRPFRVRRAQPRPQHGAG